MRFKSQEQQAAVMAKLRGNHGSRANETDSIGSRYKDSDRDGVADKDDCKPHDPNRQGFFHNVYKKYYKEPKVDRAKYAKFQKRMDAEYRKRRLSQKEADEKYRQEVRIREESRQRRKEYVTTERARATRKARFKSWITRQARKGYVASRRRFR